MDKFKIYNCHYCEKSFNYKKTLKNHTANVHGVNIGHHICKFCGKSFSKEHDLIIHKCLQTLNPKIPSSKNNSNSKPETLPNIKKIINKEKENLSDSSSSEKTKMDNFENKSMYEDYQCNLCETKNQWCCFVFKDRESLRLFAGEGALVLQGFPVAKVSDFSV